MTALVDCTSFYASVHRAFRPDLKLKPIVVLSNNDGCLVALNKEAKAIGLKRGQPYFEVKDLIEAADVTVFSSAYTLYGDLSDRVICTLGSLCPDVEVYSIDESFLSYPDSVDCETVGREIRDRVYRWTGIPVMVGWGSTHTLAKLAHEISKKRDGIFAITPDNRRKTLEDFPIEDVWGIGPAISRRLKDISINTAAQFTDLEAGFVKKEFHLPALRTWWELRGSPQITEHVTPVSNKSIACAAGFGSLVADIGELEDAFTHHATKVVEKLRSGPYEASAMSIFIMTDPYRPERPQYMRSKVVEFTLPTAYLPDIVQAGKLALRTIFRPGYQYKRIGVTLFDLSRSGQAPNDLFIQRDPKHEAIQVAVDKLNAKYGRKTLIIPYKSKNKPWAMRQQFLSPRYTTQWSEILKVK